MDKPANFVSLLEEAAGAAIPGTAQAVDEVRARLEQIVQHWKGGTERMKAGELVRFRQGLDRVRLLVDHAAARRFGLVRLLMAEEMGYTSTGDLPAPAGSSWECLG